MKTDFEKLVIAKHYISYLRTERGVMQSEIDDLKHNIGEYKHLEVHILNMDKDKNMIKSLKDINKVMWNKIIELRERIRLYNIQ